MRKPLHPGHALAAMFFAGILSLHQNAAGATTRTWSGGASMDPGWSNPANWVNGVPVAGDGLFFPAGGGHQNNNNNLAAGTTFSSLSFGGGGPPNYTLGGNSFVLDAGITVVNGGGFLYTVNNSLTLNSNQTFSVNGTTAGTLAVGAINLNSQALTFNVPTLMAIQAQGIINGPGAIFKIGGGTLTLSATNTDTGITTISNGTVYINGQQPGSPIQLAGGTLAGKGLVGTITAVGPGAQTIAPGNANPGILNCSNVALNSSSTLAVKMISANLGIGYDQLNVNGTVSLGNATLSVSSGFTPPIGTLFIILNNNGTSPIDGIFNGLPEGAFFTAGGSVFRISYAGWTGNDVVLTASKAPFTVTNAADSGPGTLRAALTAATNGDVINFALPTPTNITLTSGELVVTSSVSILGPGPGLLSVNGNFPNTTNRVFHVMGGVSASLVNLAVTNGRALGASDLGGGIYIQGSSLLISNCVLSGNAADSGGAIYNDGFGATAALTLVNSTITGNSAIFGGGLSSEGFGNTGAVTVVSSTFSSNTATNAGNALGGAIYNRAVGNGLGKITIETSTFYGNSSQSGGGAIANDPVGAGSTGSVRINASTFSGNSASVGGAIDNLPETGGTATLEIGDTLFNAGNSGGTIANNAGTVTSRGFNLSSDAAGGDGTTGPGGLLNAFGDIRNADPLLDSAGLQGNGGLTVTVALQPTSPALDKGNRAALADLALNIDQRGFSRPVGTAAVAGGDGSDIGAFELAPALLITSVTRSGNDLRVTVSGTVSGAAYELQSRSNVATGVWNSLPGSVSATNSTTQLTATNAFGQPEQFYRVQLLPW